jgi:hypothetical protein
MRLPARFIHDGARNFRRFAVLLGMEFFGHSRIPAKMFVWEKKYARGGGAGG